MFIDRITLVHIYRVLNFIQTNESKGAFNAHVHAIILNKETDKTKKKKPAFASLESMAHTIQTEYPYIQYNYKQTLPTYKESVWSLVSFSLSRGAQTLNIQTETETNFQALNGLSVKKLRTLKKADLGLEWQKEFEYKRYVAKGYMPRHYVQGQLSNTAQTLLDTYYKETRSLQK